MQDVHEMTRTEVIFELARHANPRWYHSLTAWRTEQLKALLTYYREGGDFPTNMVGEIHEGKGLSDPISRSRTRLFPSLSMREVVELIVILEM